MSYKEDIVLLKEISDGSHKAFDELYCRYAPLVKTFAYSLLKNSEESLDVCQTVFLKIWSNRKNIDSIYAFKPYLYVMVKNHILDLIEKTHTQSFTDTGLTDEMLSGVTDISALTKTEAAEDLLLCRIALESMPEKRRRVFYLSRKDHLTYQEIAEKEGISVKTVEYHISKALQELRKLVQLLLFFYSA
ncbi:MAG: RNA polymerase sigma-70 factor [Bacteroidales bacterium]|nr:RNA polymerase sigma-70 factor [Bacteroidales bacterium]